jgi:hypothetical protein
MRKTLFWIGLAVVVLGVPAWYLFRPELLFLNTTVHEDLAGADGQAGTPETRPILLARGVFHGVSHESRGVASIYKLADGRRVVHLTEFRTSNGPALRVYLVAVPDATDSATVAKAAHLDLGRLKGNEGDQSYELPTDADPKFYGSVTIWCERFSVNFATAPLGGSS